MKTSVLIRFPIFSLMLLLFMSGCNQQRAEPSGEPAPLQGKQVAFLIAEGFHDAETLFPMAYLINHGANVTVIGIEPGTYTAYNSDVNVRVEKAVAELSPDQFDALVIPGGGSPANLREDDGVVSFVRAFVDADKPTAAICHGPQVLVTAGILDGRTITGFEAIEEEITGAGATFEDVEVQVDGNLITSRIPEDLAVFTLQIARSLMD